MTIHRAGAHPQRSIEPSGRSSPLSKQKEPRIRAALFASIDGRGHKMEQALIARGIDIDHAIRSGRYIPVEAAAVLASVMIDRRVDESRFWQSVTTTISAAARASTASHPRLAACGEAAPLLWKTGLGDEAVRLERLWNDAIRTFDIALFCAYALEGPSQGKVGDTHHHQICAEHATVHSR